jgi:outer membrane protein W
MTLMKRIVLIMLSLCVMSFGLAAQALAQEKIPLNYAVVKTGVYIPNGDLDNFDNGLNIEGTFGRYFHKNFVLEGSVGLFGTEAKFNGTATALGTYTEEDSIAVIPLTVTAKGVLPLDRLELFAGAGLGVYFTALDGDLTTSNFGSFSVNDSDMVFGLHFTVGGTYNITDRFFFGIDGKYLSTGEAQYEGSAFGQTITVKGDLNGYMVNGMFGYRF